MLFSVYNILNSENFHIDLYIYIYLQHVLWNPWKHTDRSTAVPSMQSPCGVFCFINIHLWVTYSISNMRLIHKCIQQHASPLMFNKCTDYWPILQILSSASSLGSIVIDKSDLFTALTLQQHILWISRSLLERSLSAWICCCYIWSHVSP